MAVVKKSRSGRAIQLILSEDVPAGTVFQLSAGLFASVMAGGSPFVVLTRLPIPVPGDKYPKSKIWVDGGLHDAVDDFKAPVLDPSSKEFVSIRDKQRNVKKVKEVKGDW